MVRPDYYVFAATWKGYRRWLKANGFPPYSQRCLHVTARTERIRQASATATIVIADPHALHSYHAACASGLIPAHLPVVQGDLPPKGER